VRLRIEHVTTYAYTRPVTFCRHRLVLRPREGYDLRVERFDLDLSPSSRVEWIRDVFGNSIALVDWLEPAATLRVCADVIVERIAPFPAREMHEPWRVPLPPVYAELEGPIVEVYRAPTYPQDLPALHAWLSKAVVPDPHDAEGSMLALCRSIGATIRYLRREQKGVQTPAETLALGTGSCRDMATLMMEAARVCGVAARFASGYLHGRASLAGVASTHAWAEIYLPALGWRGFDPTIADVTSTSHIVTGVSTHPRGVMPVSGSFTGTASDALGLKVKVATTVMDA
jgi:transglutaminase-like putative cysteine protease